jgi:DNA-binding response OmpR family regulator
VRASGRELPILVVDDEPGFARTLAKRLGLRGHRCVVAHDGTAALDAFEPGAFRGMLLDLRLPDLGGAEVLRWVRDRDPAFPVIVMTAHGTEEDRVECLEAGARAFLAKPVDIDEIVVLLAGFGRSER